MRGFFKRLWKKVNPDPGLFECPLMENSPTALEFIAYTHIGENKKHPYVGDVIIELRSCSMGTSVQRDNRHRVVSVEPASVLGANYQHFQAVTRRSDGAVDSFLVSQLREMQDYHRTWVVVR